MIGYAAWDYRRVSQIYLEPAERDPSMRDDTLAKISTTWLFRNQFLFAQLGVTPLTRQNAQWTYDTATALLHYSPEPRVIEKAIESATQLGLNAEATAHLARYRAAFPNEYALWSKAHKAGLSPRRRSAVDEAA
jgi:type II secretory pathway component GspD/PulD (secretin)